LNSEEWEENTEKWKEEGVDEPCADHWLAWKLSLDVSLRYYDDGVFDGLEFHPGLDELVVFREMAGREDWLTDALSSPSPMSEIGARVEKREGLEGTKGLMLFTRAALKSMMWDSIDTEKRRN